jgi:thiol-disulfide isomerase/thioredoxin
LTPNRTTLVAVVLFALAAGAFAFLRPPSLRPLRIGAEPAEFRLPMLVEVNGMPRAEGLYGLDAYQGKVVFINFWATWCAPCRDEGPSLDRLYQNYRGRGFEVIAISIDAQDAMREVSSFKKDLGLTFPILLDHEQTVYAAYQATGVPETFVISREGRVVEHVVGPRDWDQPRYATLVERLLALGPEGRVDGDS